MWFNFKKYNNNTVGGVLINLVIVLTILFILAGLYFNVYLPGTTNHGESITVPNIEGMDADQLEEFLGKRNLRWEVSDSSYSDKYPPGTVLKQSPRPGAKVKENRKIFISINRVTAPTVPMPNLIDGTVTNAEAVLSANELKRGHLEYVSGPFNTVKAMKYKGHIVAPNTRVPKGAVIDLIVMDGGTTSLQAPKLVGLSLEDARVVILGSNLNIGTVELLGDTISGHALILKQKPEPNENIKVGDVVDLWIGNDEDLNQ